LLNLGALLVKVVFKMLKSIPNRVGALSLFAALDKAANNAITENKSQNYSAERVQEYNCRNPEL
jgi:hypothetical protein